MKAGKENSLPFPQEPTSKGTRKDKPPVPPKPSFLTQRKDVQVHIPMPRAVRRERSCLPISTFENMKTSKVNPLPFSQKPTSKGTRKDKPPVPRKPSFERQRKDVQVHIPKPRAVGRERSCLPKSTFENMKTSKVNPLAFSQKPTSKGTRKGERYEHKFQEKEAGNTKNVTVKEIIRTFEELSRNVPPAIMPPKKKARRDDVARGQVPTPTPPADVQMEKKGPKNIGESVNQPIMVNSVEVTAPVFGESKPVAATIHASALGTLLDNVSTDIYEGDKKEKEMRIVLIGKTGSGKSATGNTILGEKGFVSTTSGLSVTRECSQRYADRFGYKVVIVDTPGFCDTNQSHEKIQQEIFKCVGITSPGPHAFILVLSLTRYTDEEKRTVKYFENYFGDNIYNYFIVLFTRKDDLDNERKSVSDHIKTVPDELKLFLRKCGGRVIAFNNKLKGKEQDAQVLALLSMISENIKHNRGNCYTNEMYNEAEALIQIREKEIIREAKIEREEEQQEIEKMLAKEYKSKLVEKTDKLNETQTQLKEIIMATQEQVNSETGMDTKIKGSEKQVQRGQSMGMKSDELKQKLDELYQNQIDLEKKREKDKMKMERKAEEKFKMQQKNARNVVREEVEKEKGFFAKIWSHLKSYFS